MITQPILLFVVSFRNSFLLGIYQHNSPNGKSIFTNFRTLTRTEIAFGKIPKRLPKRKQLSGKSRYVTQNGHNFRENPDASPKQRESTPTYCPPKRDSQRQCATLCFEPACGDTLPAIWYVPCLRRGRKVSIRSRGG